MYRPQFSYPLPDPPCVDQACLYSFDKTNMPVFTGLLLAGARINRVPLKLDKDADFYLRAIKTHGLVSLRLDDTNGNSLSDYSNAVDGSNYELPREYSRTAGAGLAVLESGAGGVFGPAGGNFMLYLYNPTAITIDLATCAVNLVGVKRYHKEVCAQ